jgi:type IV pilus assembly protein PilO
VKDFIEKFSEWPSHYKIGAWLGVLLFFTYLYWQYLYKGPASQLEKATERIESLEGQIRHQNLIARNLPRVKEEVKILQVELSRALEELPNKQETSRLLQSISDLARDAGLEVQLFAERGESYRDFYGEKSVALTVRGGYHQIATFFDEVRRLPRIVNISGIALVQPNSTEEGIILTSECLATTFWYLSEEERAEQSKQRETKQRSRTR